VAIVFSRFFAFILMLINRPSSGEQAAMTMNFVWLIISEFHGGPAGLVDLSQFLIWIYSKLAQSKVVPDFAVVESKRVR